MISGKVIDKILDTFFEKCSNLFNDGIEKINEKKFGLQNCHINIIRLLLRDAIETTIKKEYFNSLQTFEIEYLFSNNYSQINDWIINDSSCNTNTLNLLDNGNQNKYIAFMQAIYQYIQKEKINIKDLVPILNHYILKEALSEIKSLKSLLLAIQPKIEWPSEIMNIDDFIKKHDYNTKVAPLNLNFLFREQEVKELCDKLQENDLIIINGKPGYGKTRLALETAKRFSIDYKYQIFCIKELSEEALKTFQIKLEKNQNYLLILDDVNNFDNNTLNHLFSFAIENKQDYTFKFVLSIRDCFTKSIVNICSSYFNPDVFTINKLSDEQITIFLDKILEIKNPCYVNQIIKICEGNIRLAYFAGLCAIKNQNLESISDSSKLFELYYEDYFEKIGLNNNEKLLKTAGLLSLFRKVDTKLLSKYKQLIMLCNMTESDFCECCKQLTKLEIVENEFDNIYRISENCMENYFLYLFIFNKKYISFSNLVLSFEQDLSFLLSRINTVFPIFYSNENYKYIEKEINCIWSQMLEKDCAYTFVKIFNIFNIIGSISYAKDLVDKTEKSEVNLTDIHFDRNNNFVNDRILELLGSFSNSDKLRITLQLMFRYINKNQESLVDGFYIIKNRFSINENSINNDFKRENILIETLLEEKRDNEILAILFLQVSKLFLNFVFQISEEGRHFSITLKTIYLPCTTGSKNYRKLIWTELKNLLSQNLYVEDIISILDSYGSGWPEKPNKELLEFDKPYILKLINMLPAIKWPFIVSMKGKLNKIWKNSQISQTNICKRKIGDFKIEVYNLFISENYYDGKYEKKILKFKSKHSDKQCKEILQILEEIIINNNEFSNKIYWNFNTFIKCLDKVDLITTILFCKESKTPLMDSPRYFVERLFKLSSKEETYDFICNTDLPNKNLWKFYYFTLPENNKQTKRDFENFLTILKEGYEDDGYMKDLSYSSIYLKHDKDAFVKIFTKVLSYSKNQNYTGKIYLYHFFNDKLSPAKLIKYFDSNKELLQKLYLIGIKSDDLFDYHGNYLYYFLENIPDFIPKYADTMISQISDCKDLRHDISKIWNCKNYNEIIQTIMKKAQEKNIYNSMLKKLFTSGNELETQWLLSEIKKHNNNENYMIFLFDIISELSESQRLLCVKQFIINKGDITLFKKLHLTPNSMSTSGSFIPIYKSIIIYLETIIKEIPEDIDFLDYINHIESLINSWKEYIREEEKREYINKINFD